MSRRTLFLVIGFVLLLHVGAFIWLSKTSLPAARATPRGENHFDHIAVRVQKEDGENYIVRQYTVSTDLADPTPQFVEKDE